MKVEVYVLLVGLVGACAGFTINSKTNTVPIRSAAQTYQANESELCTAVGENVAISPDGKFAIFDQNISRDYSPVSDGTRLTVLNVQCAISKKSFHGCLTGISSMAGIRLMSWGSDGQSLFLIENNKHLLKIDLKATESKGEVVDQVQLHSRGIALTVMRMGTTDSISAQEENDQLEDLRIRALQGFNSQEAAGIFLKSNAVVGAIFEDSNDLHLYTVLGGVRQDLKTKWREVPKSQLAYKSLSSFKSNEILIAADGAEASSSADSFTSIEGLPFAKPMISSEDGSLLGYYNGSRVKLSGSPEFSNRVQEIIEKRKNSNNFIQSIAASSNDVHAQIIKGIDGGKSIVVAASEGVVEKSCFSEGARTPKADVEYVVMGPSNWTVYSLSIRPSNSKGLIVFFGGGPLNNIEKLPFSMRQFLQLNWSVLAVNYSGSIGSGTDVSGRLYNFGLKNAFRRDAAAVVDYLKLNAQIKERIVIYGESLGALPAISLDGLLDTSREMILVAPFLKHRPPSEWVKEESEENKLAAPINISYQEKYEKYLIGEQVDKYQKEILRLKKTDARTLAIFAQNDRVSSSNHVPNFWRNGNFSVDIVPGGHALSSAQPETWKIINNWMGL